MKTVGSRAQVYHRTAKHTSGGLFRKHLMKNKHGRIVSKKKRLMAKKEKIIDRLYGKGFKPCVGSFKLFDKRTDEERGQINQDVRTKEFCEEEKERYKPIRLEAIKKRKARLAKKKNNKKKQNNKTRKNVSIPQNASAIPGLNYFLRSTRK